MNINDERITEIEIFLRNQLNVRIGSKSWNELDKIFYSLVANENDNSLLKFKNKSCKLMTKYFNKVIDKHINIDNVYNDLKEQSNNINSSEDVLNLYFHLQIWMN